MHQPTTGWLQDLNGQLSLDPYSTAWVALVPKLGDLSVPSWPEALDYLRKSQLADGGWGEPAIMYAHERTLATVAAIHALDTWQTDEEDHVRIQRAISALDHYADILPLEPEAPIGFELLLPTLWRQMDSEIQSLLPLGRWSQIDELYQKKTMQLASLRPDKPHSWWFSMEMLPSTELALLDDSILAANGSVVTATAPTAAYLRARRLSGEDSSRSAAFLNNLVEKGNGGVPFCNPIEIFEQVWVLDSLRRAGADPQDSSIACVLDNLYKAWYTNDPGLSFSDHFPVNDGDDTAVGLTLLQWGGYQVNDQPLLNLWNSDHFLSYPNERSESVSMNIHALIALRNQKGFPHYQKAKLIVHWLTDHIRSDRIFADKWHVSPFYSISHAIEAFAGLDNTVAQRCISFMLEHQQQEGGWGWFGISTTEETAFCIMGLVHALRHGLLDNVRPLEHAAQFMQARVDTKVVESLWIGKTLFLPTNIVNAAIYSAHDMLAQVSGVTQTQYRAFI